MFERMKEYELVWHDEFDYEGAPDPMKWNYDLGNHQWANRELQAYTDRPGNVFVRDGRLTIRALKEKGLPYIPYFVPGSHDWYCWPEMFTHFAKAVLWK